MSSKINSGIFVIAALTLMVAGTLYGGMTNAFAQQSNNVGNFATNTQANSAVVAVDSSATGGAGGYAGFLGTGGAGGSATGGAVNVGISQSNSLSNTQVISEALLVGANIDKRDCGCPGGAQTNNVGNFATNTQANSAIVAVDSSATGGAGGSIGGSNGLIPIGGGTGGAGGSATGGAVSVGISQSNSLQNTQVISEAILAGINFAR